MFIASKIDLQRKSEIKDQLTEHLYTVINKNEVRKAQKLGELMKEMEMEPEAFDMPDVLPLATFNTLNPLQTLRPKKAVNSETKPTDMTNKTSPLVGATTESNRSDGGANDSAVLDCSKKETCENIENPSDNLVIVSVTGNSNSSDLKNENQPENLSKESKVEASTILEGTNDALDNRVHDNSPTEAISPEQNSRLGVGSTSSQNTDQNRSQMSTADDASKLENDSSPSTQNTVNGSPVAIDTEANADSSEGSPSGGDTVGGQELTDTRSSSSTPNSWLFPFSRVKKEPS